VDNIDKDLREIGWDVVGWITLGEDRDQWRANNGKAMSNCITGDFSGRARLGSLESGNLTWA
jgi:hypothetical protein